LTFWALNIPETFMPNDGNKAQSNKVQAIFAM
jgi:hypothetical protein